MQLSFFLSLSLSLSVYLSCSLFLCPTLNTEGNCPLVASLAKTGKTGGKEAEQIREFLQKILRSLSTFMRLITDNNPLLLFKLMLIIVARHVAPH